MSLDTLQKEVLQPNELMLVYGVMENSIALWVIGKETFQMFDLSLTYKKRDENIKDIRLAVDWRLDTRNFVRTDIEKPLSENKLSELTYELYNLLFPFPVRPLVEKAGTVYIVPTGVLNAKRYLRDIASTAPVMELSAKNKSGMPHWLDWISEQVANHGHHNHHSENSII